MRQLFLPVERISISLLGYSIFPKLIHFELATNIKPHRVNKLLIVNNSKGITFCLSTINVNLKHTFVLFYSEYRVLTCFCLSSI